MLILLSCFLVQSLDTLSYLPGSELSLTGHSGIQLSTSEISCYLGIFNSSYPFGIQCGQSYPLYIDETRRTHLGGQVLTESKLYFSGPLTLGSVNQWNLLFSDMFQDTEASTWTNKSITECAGIRMLGGYCQYSAGNSSTLISINRDHSQVRVKFNFHFIDQWRGESAYLNLGSSKTNETIWSFTYDYAQSKNPINICGSALFGEGKFSLAVDVVYEHTAEKLLILLGSTLEEQPCEKSWGISGLEVYIR